MPRYVEPFGAKVRESMDGEDITHLLSFDGRRICEGRHPFFVVKC